MSSKAELQPLAPDDDAMSLKSVLWRSLKTRVTVGVLAIFGFGIWSLAFYGSRMLREDMERLLGEQQFSTVSMLAAQIDEELGERLKALETIAAGITQATLDKPAALQALLEQRPIFRDHFNGGILAFGPDGTVIADVPRSGARLGANYMDRDFVASALKKGKTTIGRPFIGRQLKAPIFAMNVPIRDVQGQLIGALGGVIDLSKPNFLNTIMEQRYGKTGGYLLIAPRHRLIVTASDRRRIMAPIAASGIHPLAARFMGGYEGSGVLVNVLGEEVLSSAKGIPVAGWFMVANISTAEVFAPIHDMQQRLLFAAIFLTLLAGGLTWWMLSRQLAPMLAAVKTLANLSDTNQPAQHLPIARQDEIGELIGGFNRLLETLGKRGKALRESEDRYRDLVEHSQQLICTHDLEGRILSVNPWAAKILGYKEAELVNMNLRDVLASGVRQEFEGYLTAIRTQGAAQGLMQVQTRAGGKRVWEFNNTLRTDGVATPIVRGMAHDVTERERAERELRHKTELAQLLEQLARAANQAVSPEAAMETCLIRMAEQGKWVLGHLATLGPGPSYHPDRSHWHCAEPARFAAFMNYSEYLQFNPGAGRFVSVVMRDQSPVWLPDLTALDSPGSHRMMKAVESGLKAAFAFPVIVGGEVAAILEFFATETRQSDALLIEGATGLAGQFARLIERSRATAAQARLATIIEHSNDAIIGRVLDSTVVSWNAAAERLLGYAAAEVIGRNPVEIIPPELRQEAAEWREQLKAGHTLQNIESMRVTKDGRYIDVAVSFAATRDGGGNIIGTAAIVRDITQRKQAEQILRESTARLQTVSRKLLSVQEDERRRLARELHDQVGQVLTAIKINLQVIGRQPAAAPVASKIGECVQIADAALQQVRTLMLDLRPPQLDELGLAVALRSHAERVVAPSNLDLHFSAPDTLPKIPPEMEIVCFRIMQEAVTNILRHAGARNVWIELAVAGDGLTLSVRDDGKGFDLAEAHQRAIAGGSIGLLSMEERATLADGRIGIITASGEGTTVRAMFSLQVVRPAAATA